jgi:magnesium-transporting ATPase (P-type)
MEFNGNVTEKGLLKFFLALYNTNVLDEDYKALQGIRDRLKPEDLLASFRFSSARKMASMAIKTGDDEVTIFVKGAPDIMFSRATNVLAFEDGAPVTKSWDDVCDNVSDIQDCQEGATY